MSDTDDYGEALDAFLRACTQSGDCPTVTEVYHAVRNLTYASDGNRTPAGVLETGRGSCTGKHLLLRDLLRRMGERAEVETVEGDFALGVPAHPTMSPALLAFAGKGGTRDFHNYVVWEGPHGAAKLDATWPDAMAGFGFAVNSDWAGQGNSGIALTPVSNRGTAEDVIEYKKRLLSELSAQETADRLSFLALLTGWIAGHSTGSD